MYLFVCMFVCLFQIAAEVKTYFQEFCLFIYLFIYRLKKAKDIKTNFRDIFVFLFTVNIQIILTTLHCHIIKCKLSFIYLTFCQMAEDIKTYFQELIYLCTYKTFLI